MDRISHDYELLDLTRACLNDHPMSAMFIHSFDAALDGIPVILEKQFNVTKTKTAKNGKRYEFNYSFLNSRVSCPGVISQNSVTMRNTPSSNAVLAQTYSFTLTADVKIEIRKVYDENDKALCEKLSAITRSMLYGSTREQDLTIPPIHSFTIENGLKVELPCIVGSKLMPMNAFTPYMIYTAGGDWTDKGGYWVISGKDKTIPATESKAYNVPTVVQNEHLNEEIRLEMLSMHGVQHEHSAQLVILKCRPKNKSKNTEVARADQAAIRYDVIARINSEQRAVAALQLRGEVPIMALFVAFGCTRESDILEYIFPDANESRNPKLQDIIVSMMEVFAHGESHVHYRADKQASTSSEDALYYIGKRMLNANVIKNDVPIQAKGYASAFLKSEGRQAEAAALVPLWEKTIERTLIIARTRNALYEYFLPHLNPYDDAPNPRVDVTPETQRIKCTYLGWLVRSVMDVHAKNAPETDRDAAYFKRTHPSGYRYAIQFRTTFNVSFISGGIDRAVEKQLETPDKLENEIKTNIARYCTDFEKSMRSKLQKNQKTLIGGRLSEPRLISEQFERTSINKINGKMKERNSRSSAADRQVEQSLIVRQLHATQMWFLDSLQTPENKDTCGRQKQTTLLVDISHGVSPKAIADGTIIDIMALVHSMIRTGPTRPGPATAAAIQRETNGEGADASLIRINDVPPNKVYGYYFVTINMTPVALADRRTFRTFVRELRQRIRTDPLVHSHTTVSVDEANMRIEIFTDAGRELFPALIVHEETNDVVIPEAYTTDADGQKRFVPWNKLLKSGHIELIDSAYARECIIAPSYEDFLQMKADCAANKLRRITSWTHVPLPSSFLGCILSVVPFVSHNKVQRSALACTHMMQSMGVPVLNPHCIGTKFVDIQHRVDVPLCGTFVYNALNYERHAFGKNVIMAVMSLGANQEDSIIMNADAVSRGLFNASRHKSQSQKIRDKDRVMLPDQALISQPRANYSQAVKTINPETGLPKSIGTPVFKGDVLISIMELIPEEAKLKMSKLNGGRPIDVKYWDRSLLHKDNDDRGELAETPAYIDSSGIVQEGPTKIAQVNYHIPRSPIVGDKCGTCSMQKGVIGALQAAADMPFTADGLIPDVIMNVHGVVKRETHIHPLLMLVTVIATYLGTFIDATAFIERYKEENIGKLLEEFGFRANGKQTMYCGKTGEQYEAEIFIGIPDYHRLAHMVNDKMFSRSIDGPKDPVKRQPVKGRAKGGGLKMGEMEIKAIQSSGCMELMQEIKANCDAFDVYVCKTCKSICYPSVPPNCEYTVRDIVCPVCKNSGSQQCVMLNVPWSAIMVKRIVESAGFRMDLVPSVPIVYGESATQTLLEMQQMKLPPVAEEEGTEEKDADDADGGEGEDEVDGE